MRTPSSASRADAMTVQTWAERPIRSWRRASLWASSRSSGAGTVTARVAGAGGLAPASFGMYAPEGHGGSRLLNHALQRWTARREQDRGRFHPSFRSTTHHLLEVEEVRPRLWVRPRRVDPQRVRSQDWRHGYGLRELPTGSAEAVLDLANGEPSERLPRGMAGRLRAEPLPVEAGEDRAYRRAQESRDARRR